MCQWSQISVQWSCADLAFSWQYQLRHLKHPLTEFLPASGKICRLVAHHYFDVGFDEHLPERQLVPILYNTPELILVYLHR